MEGGEDEMTGFARSKRDAHCFGIPHFADNNHIRRLPQCRSERCREVRCIDSDLNMLDEAFFDASVRTRPDLRS
jgi:hypothetical protein